MVVHRIDHDIDAPADPTLPPMGIRVRLRPTFDISGFPPQTRVILQALKDYGMILTDSGPAWSITGAPDPRWDNNDLHSLETLHGAEFDVVDESGLMVDPNSGQSR